MARVTALRQSTDTVFKLKPVEIAELISRTLLREEFEQVHKELNGMDYFGFNTGGDCCEIEIKVADYDFNKEFTKKWKIWKHNQYKKNGREGSGFCPTRFYFMVPENLYKKAIKRMKRYPSRYGRYGLIVFNTFNGHYTIIKKSDRLTEMPFSGELLPYQRGNRWTKRRK